MVLRLSRFGSGFRERVDRVRVFWSAQRGARIAVPRCSRVYIWSAKTRRLSVRVHQNQTLRSTLLTMQGGYGPLSLWQQHRCSSWRQTQSRDGPSNRRQQQQQRTSLRQHSTRVYIGQHKGKMGYMMLSYAVRPDRQITRVEIPGGSDGKKG